MRLISCQWELRLNRLRHNARYIITFYFLQAQLEEAKKAAQVRPEMIRAETVTTTEAVMDHAEPNVQTTGTSWRRLWPT